MSIEVISIGSELLTGFTINTNAAYISRQLFMRGIPTRHHTIVPDDAEEMRQAFEKALERSRFVIATGGLGPTCDDMTKRVAAELFDAELCYDEAVADSLRKRYGDKLLSLEEQATVPVKAEIIPNALGTASGFLFKRGASFLFLLPGVPPEMCKMFEEVVLPYIDARISDEERLHCEWLHFMGVIESQVDPHLRVLQERSPDLDFGIYPYRGFISLRAAISRQGGRRSQESLAQAIGFLREKYRDFLFEEPSGKIEEALHTLLIEKGLTVSTAESCTGGSIASRLVLLPGASAFFLGSVVAYSCELKTKLLGVSKELLETKGAVSQEVVEEMASGLLAITGSDYGIAVSGIAGPAGGRADKPVGTVWAAIAKRGEKPFSWLMRAHGSREMIIDYTVNSVLGKLYFAVRGFNQ